MASGRCSGCGHAGTIAHVTSHTLICDAYIELYRTDRSRALSPAAEAAEHRRRNTAQARAVDRDLRLRARFAELEQEVRVQSTRWRTPPDLLAD